MENTSVPSAVDLEAQGITLERQIPATAMTASVTVADVILTTTTAPVPEGVAERGVALLTPGFTSSKETFYPIMGALASRGYRAISFSQRGQPGSTGPDAVEGYPLARLGQDIHDLLAALDLESTPVHLLGHSFGGVVAMESVLTNPEQFASLTLWNSGPRRPDDDFAGAIEMLRTHGPRALWVADRTNAGLDPDADTTGTLDVIEQYYFDRLMSAVPAQLDAALQILDTQQDRTADLTSVVARTGLPVLISHGAQDDAWPIAWQRQMAEDLGADYWVMARAGHSAHADRSGLAASLLADFWDSTLA
jgi:pimeloyl-ACP methyl ester carboxylesterase